MTPQVTVYSTTTCPYCDMMKNFLDAQGIPYQNVDVQKDPIAAAKLVQTTGQMGVPQTNVNGEWVLGFDSNHVMQILGK